MPTPALPTPAVTNGRISTDGPHTGPWESRVQTALRLRAENRLSEALDVLAAPGAYTQDVYTLRGDLQRDLGRLHEAVGSYSTVSALDPQNAYAHQQLAHCLRKLGRWDVAAEAFRKILASDSYSDAARIGLGECQLQLAKPEEALACFEACWSEAALAAALFGKAVALQMLRRFEESEALYLRFVELHPHPEEALRNLIALNLERFDLGRVERYATRLLTLQAGSIAALQALTIVAFERREYATAAEFYRRLLEIVPEEKLVSCGNDDVFEYRVSRRSRDLLHQFQMKHQPKKQYG